MDKHTKIFGLQTSAATPIQKAYSGTEADVATVEVVVRDDFARSERVVTVKRGALARAALSALTGGRGHDQIRQLDFSLIDRGICRKSLWDALGLEESSGTPMKKSEPAKQSAQDRMLEAVAELDQLAERMKRGEEQ